MASSHLFVPKGTRKNVADEILRTFARKRADPASREAARAFAERDAERKGKRVKVGKAMAIEDAIFFADQQGIEPPYPPEALAMVFEHSSALRPCIDAYVANCDGTGHRFSPLLDLESDDAEQRVSDAILIERSLTDATPVPPTPEEVKTRIEDLRIAMKVEEHRLDSFFQFLCYDISFIALRRRTRTDLETNGNAYWELNRGDDGKIATAQHIPSVTMRLGKLDAEEVEVEQRIMKGPLTWGARKVRRRFRRYIQRVGGKRMWFKELGDPRVLSRSSGKFYVDDKALQREEKGALPATEILHFSVWSPRSPYGIPRWIGALVAILGARHAEEVNFFYFDNKSVPPLAILVSGGSITGETKQAIQDHIDNGIKGRGNFHAILVIEADSNSPSVSGMSGENRTKIEMKSLTEAQHDDALFQNYDTQSGDKVGEQFRLPRMLRGVDKGYNRSCYSEDTETLTETGWKFHHEIGPDEKIAAYDPKTREMRFVVPEKKLVYDVVDEELTRFHNKHTDCFVTHDHTMLVQNAASGALDPQWEVFKADSIPHNVFNVTMAAAKWASGNEIDRFELPQIETCKQPKGHEHPTSVKGDDWLEFLGYWISEGGLLMTDHHGAPYYSYVDQKKPEICAKIRACLDRLGWKYSVQEKPCGTTHFLFSNRCLRDWLVKNCGTHSGERKIPPEYLNLSARQLHILFDALMDGDGTVGMGKNDTNATYYSKSTILIDQVQRLLVQLGFRAVVSFSKGAHCWRCSFTPRTTSMLHATAATRNPACVEKVRYTGAVYCFSVPGWGFFVTRRNGKVAFQGNTSESALLFAEQQVFGPERDEFDFIINRRILTAEMGIRFFEFCSNPPGNMAPEVLSKIIRDLTNASVLTPAEARNFAERVFGETLRRIDEPWTQQPINLTIAGMGQDTAADGAEPEPESPDEDAGDPDEPGDGAAPKKPIKKLPTPPERGPGRKSRRSAAQELIALHNDLMKRERAGHLARAYKERAADNERDNPL